MSKRMKMPSLTEYRMYSSSWQNFFSWMNCYDRNLLCFQINKTLFEIFKWLLNKLLEGQWKKFGLVAPWVMKVWSRPLFTCSSAVSWFLLCSWLFPWKESLEKSVVINIKYYFFSFSLSFLKCACYFPKSRNSQTYVNRFFFMWHNCQDLRCGGVRKQSQSAVALCCSLLGFPFLPLEYLNILKKRKKSWKPTTMP